MPDHRKHPAVNLYHTFEIDPPDCRPHCFNERDVLFWDVENPDAWLACEDAPLTRDYR